MESLAARDLPYGTTPKKKKSPTSLDVPKRDEVLPVAVPVLHLIDDEVAVARPLAPPVPPAQVPLLPL